MFDGHDLARCELNRFVDYAKASTYEDKQLAYASMYLLGDTNFRALQGLDIGLLARFRP